MPLEIERRLLLKKIPDVKFDECHEIIQVYCPNGRFRHACINVFSQPIMCDKYTRTVKKRIGKGINEEIEVEISKKEFKSEMKRCTKIIHKTRYIKNVGKRKWEVDVFDFLYLIIAEVEVRSKKELKTVTIPKFIKDQLICDVTGRNEFSNFNLADRCLKKK